MKGLGAQLFVYIGLRFSDSFLKCSFCRFLCLTVSLSLRFQIDLGSIETNSAKTICRRSGNFGKEGAGPYNNLWSRAVLGHGASWSLVTGKWQGGGSGWQLVTPCARRAVEDIHCHRFENFYVSSLPLGATSLSSTLSTHGILGSNIPNAIFNKAKTVGNNHTNIFVNRDH